jgi:hypothetical protein
MRLQLRGFTTPWSLANWPAGQPWRPFVKKEIGEELGHSVRLQKLLLADSTRVDRIVRAASRHAVLAELLARFATGAVTHGQFQRSMLVRALPVYVREKTRQLLRR